MTNDERNPKSECRKISTAQALVSSFGFCHSFGFGHSSFGFAVARFMEERVPPTHGRDAAGRLCRYCANRATTVAAPTFPGNSTHSPLNFFHGLPLTVTDETGRPSGSRKRTRSDFGGLRRGPSIPAVISF